MSLSLTSGLASTVQSSLSSSSAATTAAAAAAAGTRSKYNANVNNVQRQYVITSGIIHNKQQHEQQDQQQQSTRFRSVTSTDNDTNLGNKRRPQPRVYRHQSVQMIEYRNTTKDNDKDNENENEGDDHADSYDYDDDDSTNQILQKKWQHLYILPVLLLEYTALALTRAVLPALLLHEFGRNVYIIMGFADFIRGLLAFVSSPMFGKVSDTLGRRVCLFVTVIGTCAPVCSLALFSWHSIVIETSSSSGPFGTTSKENNNNNIMNMNNNNPVLLEGATTQEMDTTTTSSAILGGMDESMTTAPPYPIPITEIITTSTLTPINPYAIIIFVILFAMAGIFASTFTLVFAYISDTVPKQEERVSAYGLALATFGLSFTIGPMAGGYLAQTNPQFVFITSLVLVLLDLVYIYAILPESRQLVHSNDVKLGNDYDDDDDDNDNADIDYNPSAGMTTSSEMSSSNTVASVMSTHDISWNPLDSLNLVLVDPLLRQVGKVSFLYYTGLWALISTLSVYAVKQFHLTPNRLGELMSAIGLSTMVAEVVLVRIMVPMFGEKVSMKIGLLSFAIQCIVLGFAYEPWHLFLCAVFSMFGNLVYPSLTSLVSGNVEPDMVGEALGAINGIKALTEGIGPLVFGCLMTIAEHSVLPGWPYLLAAGLVLAAYIETEPLPDLDNDEYIHELDRKKYRQETLKQRNQQVRRRRRRHYCTEKLYHNTKPTSSSSRRIRIKKSVPAPSGTCIDNDKDNDKDEEIEALLSDVDEMDDEETNDGYIVDYGHQKQYDNTNNNRGRSTTTTPTLSVTLGSFTQL